MNKIVCLFIAGAVFSCKKDNIPGPVTAVSKVEVALTASLDSIRNQGIFNGFGVAVVTADSIVYQNGFGFADRAAGLPYTVDTRQPIASVSKTFIGVALLKAQEMGKLKLDDPVNKYLPFKVSNPEFPHIDITIGHLATHTSTINDEGTSYMQEAYVADKDIPASEYPDYDQSFNAPSTDKGLEAFLQKELGGSGADYSGGAYNSFMPGQYYEYSNMGATLAALVLEKATGMPYDAFVAKYILQPLGMKHSGFYGKDTDYKGRSLLYINPDKPLPQYHCITYPDGGMVTSAGDMALYLQELVRGYSGSGKLLSKESYKELFTTYLGPRSFLDGQETENPYSDEYNSGLFIGFSPEGYIGHTGGDPGISSLMFFDPKTGVGRFLMVNTDSNDKKGNDAFYAIWDKLSAAIKK